MAQEAGWGLCHSHLDTPVAGAGRTCLCSHLGFRLSDGVASEFQRAVDGDVPVTVSLSSTWKLDREELSGNSVPFVGEHICSVLTYLFT